MLRYLTELARNAMDAINQGNPGALLSLFFISALTEIGIPFPFILDTILIFTGYQTGLISIKVGLIMLSLLMGREVGASVIYWFTRVASRAFFNRISRRFPFLQKRMDWLADRLRRYTPAAVAIARLTPGLLTPSTIAAAVLSIRYWYLVLGIAISSVIADGVLLILGFTAGRSLEHLGVRPSVWVIIVGLVILLGIIWVVSQYLSRHTSK